MSEVHTSLSSKKVSIQGFTLVEIIIVIAILSIFAGITVTTLYPQIEYRIIAQKVLEDSKQFELAWRLWQSDTQQPFPADTTSTSCVGAGNHAVQNTSMPLAAPFNGTTIYMKSVPKDYFGRPYYYYNDDSGTGCDGTTCGISVVDYWCTMDEGKKMWSAAKSLDQQIDKTDGSVADGTTGRILYLPISTDDTPTQPWGSYGQIIYQMAANPIN